MLQRTRDVSRRRILANPTAHCRIVLTINATVRVDQKDLQRVVAAPKNCCEPFFQHRSPMPVGLTLALSLARSSFWRFCYAKKGFGRGGGVVGGQIKRNHKTRWRSSVQKGAHFILFFSQMLLRPPLYFFFLYFFEMLLSGGYLTVTVDNFFAFFS